MEVILREEIDNLGIRGDVVKVAPGYARNFLIPRKLAVLATEANKKIVAQEREAWLRREAVLKGEAQELAALLAKVTLSFTQKAGETGQLFGSVTNKDIADGLASKGFTIDRKKIILSQPIKQVGDFTVPVKLHREVTVDVPVHVLPEGGVVKAAETAVAEAATVETAVVTEE
ncbi:MAG: 50S ribosomal protein L9 [Bryobacterales bacterium]|jgi:large subunit ribosomal protein L9|nr:50S ribosomal protein L9 [Bryobacterales bacterium]